MKNIIVEVEQDKPGLEWLEQQGAPLNTMQRETDPTPNVYVQAVEKFAKMKVPSADAASSLQFTVEVTVTLKDALANLLAIEWSSKPEVIVIFSYNTHGESLYVWPMDVLAVNARIFKEEENQEEDMYNPSNRILLAPMTFICDNAGTVNVQAFAAKSQTQVWSAHHTLYLPAPKDHLVMDPRSVVHLIHCYPIAVN